MNFAHNSLKLKSKTQNEDFCFDIATAQGHFFAVLDFAPHDYANLNATLSSKLETIVGSFASLSKFSADLFLGFLAKEINNFLHHLGEQSSGPEILCSAALSLVGGNRLSYLLCGDVRIDITGGRLLSLSADVPEAVDTSTDELETSEDDQLNAREFGQLGIEKLEAPLTDRVRSFTLLDDDIVLIMTHGLEAGFDRRQLPRELMSVGSPEPKLICEALMKASASSRDDRTVVVIAGPYEPDVDPALSDLSKAIAVLEARVDKLSEQEGSRESAAQVVERESGADLKRDQVVQQLEELRAELSGRAAASDLLAFEQKLKSLSEAIDTKADSARVQGLQHDVLKLRKDTDARSTVAEPPVTNDHQKSRRPSAVWIILLVLATIGSGFLGAWLHSRVFRKGAEVWTVRTSANQLVIRRLDGEGREEQRTVNLAMAQPLNSTGEQTFSSFGDVAQYIDKLTTPNTAVATGQPPAAGEPGASPSPEGVIEISVKPGDSLREFAERYQVSADKIKELNPSINKWTSIRSGQKIKVPASAEPGPTAAPAVQATVQSDPSTTPANESATIEVIVGPGDSINRFAQRYKSTPARLKELNPQITNWGAIRIGQKLIVPSPPGG